MDAPEIGVSVHDAIDILVIIFIDITRVFLPYMVQMVFTLLA